MFNPRSHVMAFVSAAVVALAVAADYLGMATGSPHPLNTLRIAGFVAIAIGLFFILRRE